MLSPQQSDRAVSRSSGHLNLSILSALFVFEGVAGGAYRLV